MEPRNEPDLHRTNVELCYLRQRKSHWRADIDQLISTDVAAFSVTELLALSVKILEAQEKYFKLRSQIHEKKMMIQNVIIAKLRESQDQSTRNILDCKRLLETISRRLIQDELVSVRSSDTEEDGRQPSDNTQQLDEFVSIKRDDDVVVQQRHQPTDEMKKTRS
jgi:hypothetical protein